MEILVDHLTRDAIGLEPAGAASITCQLFELHPAHITSCARHNSQSVGAGVGGVAQGGETGEVAVLEQLETGATTGGNVADLIGNTRLVHG